LDRMVFVGQKIDPTTPRLRIYIIAGFENFTVTLAFTLTFT